MDSEEKTEWEDKTDWIFFHSPDGDMAEELLSLSKGETLVEAAQHVEGHRMAQFTADQLLNGIKNGTVMACKVDEWYTNYSPENIPDHEL